MIQGRCPICSKTFSIARLEDLPSFPFCSDRCKLIDLGRWIDGAYAISAKAPESAEDQDSTSQPAQFGEDEED